MQAKENIFSPNKCQYITKLCFLNNLFLLLYLQVELCHMPGLAIILTLDYCRLEHGNYVNHDSVVGDLVAFISGLLLGSDDKVRNWIGQYFRNCQKVLIYFFIFLKCFLIH